MEYTAFLERNEPNMKKLTILLALCLGLAGCAQPAPSQSGVPENPASPETPTSSEENLGGASSHESTAVLYIGTKAAGFQEYPISYEGELTPELLIQGISELTGWDLTIAGEVTTGKGGMSVCFSGESALFSGPPDPQKDEFHVFSADQLAETILDSIQKTLQEGFTGEGGNPDELDIYYFLEGEQPLELPDLGLSWPLDQPYQWTCASTNG